MPHFAAVVLAAGKGTRMKSELPKVMHVMAGQPLIDYVLNNVHKLGINDVFTIVGYGREIVAEHIKDRSQVIVQTEQLGTGHALLQALPYLTDDAVVLVLSGDQPLLTVETLRALLRVHLSAGASATVLSAWLENPYGYGRIIKEKEILRAIVEEKDADSGQKQIKEINTGAYCFEGKALKSALAEITPQNAQGEYYLTDVFKIMVDSGRKIITYCLEDSNEALGINNQVQLAEAEDLVFDRIRKFWMMGGVRIINPATVFIETQAVLNEDVVIHPFTFIKGNTRIEKNSVIGPQTSLENCLCQRGCHISYSVAREAQIGENSVVGPYAFLRPGTVLEKGVKIGDFVEIKKSTVGEGSKVPHLSYIGDSTLGKNVNVGAGTITCNYDGKQKYLTIIGDNAFVGSNTNFVAPVEIGKEAVIGAGSTITKNVPDKALAVARSQQKNIDNWHKAKDK